MSICICIILYQYNNNNNNNNNNIDFILRGDNSKQNNVNIEPTTAHY